MRRQASSSRTLTKIVCTIGPSSDNMIVLKDMIEAGMSVARLNFSHGDHASLTKLFRLIRKASRETRNVAIMCDIQGPKIRTGRMERPFNLKEGEEIRITSRNVLGTRGLFTVDLPGMEKILNVGEQVYINDGTVRLKVVERKDDALTCEVRSGGWVSDRKGCNVPSSKLKMEFPSRKDIGDLKLIARLDPEYVAGSFIGTQKDVDRLRDVLSDNGNDRSKVVSKIERPMALKNHLGIISRSDGIMVARGDLGVEIPPQDVPAAQKDLCRACNRAGKPVIVATQMLESMVEHSRPTRAEANDVYNAVLDGADALMLSSETSLGKHPVLSVGIMTDIIRRAESDLPPRDPDFFDTNSRSIAEASGHAVHTLLEELRESGLRGRVVAYTRTGHIARMISKYRPGSGLIAVTPSRRTLMELELVWGVRPLLVGEGKGGSIEKRMASAVRAAEMEGLLDAEDHVITASSSMERPGSGILLGIYGARNR